MFSFFKKEPKASISPLTTDIHSHLLAGLDDGVKTMEEAEGIIQNFYDLGYRKLITTPHIMSDYYRNSPETVLGGLEELKLHISGKIDMQLEAAAEYYLDEEMMKKIGRSEPLLTFGNRYLLFETNFISEPLHLKEFIFNATSAGYKPVLAHPERYQYMTIDKAADLRDREVLFQLNTLSLIGYYSKPVQRMAYQFIDRGWVDLLGSDCHIPEQVGALSFAQKNKHYQKALALPLLNNSL